MTAPVGPIIPAAGGPTLVEKAVAEAYRLVDEYPPSNGHGNSRSVRFTLFWTSLGDILELYEAKRDAKELAA